MGKVWAKFGQVQAKFGQSFGKVWAKFGQVWAKFRQSSGKVRAKFRQVRAKFGQSSGKLGQYLRMIYEEEPACVILTVLNIFSSVIVSSNSSGIWTIGLDLRSLYDLTVTGV